MITDAKLNELQANVENLKSKNQVAGGWMHIVGEAANVTLKEVLPLIDEIRRLRQLVGEKA